METSSVLPTNVKMANKRPDENMDEEEVKVKRKKLTSDELLVDVTTLYLVVYSVFVFVGLVILIKIMKRRKQYRKFKTMSKYILT